MNGLEEALKGFSDLPIAAICLVFGVLAAGRRARGYSVLFYLTAVAASVGAFVHICRMPVAAQNAVWTVLYPLLYEAVRRFCALFSAYAAKKEKEKKERRGVLLTEAVLCVGSIAALWIWTKFDMLFFIVFCALCVADITVRVAFAWRRLSSREKGNVRFLAVTAPAALLLQACSEWIPYAIVWEHTVLVAALTGVYRIARDTVSPLPREREADGTETVATQ